MYHVHSCHRDVQEQLEQQHDDAGLEYGKILFSEKLVLKSLPNFSMQIILLSGINGTKRAPVSAYSPFNTEYIGMTHPKNSSPAV